MLRPTHIGSPISTLITEASITDRVAITRTETRDRGDFAMAHQLRVLGDFCRSLTETNA